MAESISVLPSRIGTQAKDLLRRPFRRLGYDLVKYDQSIRERSRLLRQDAVVVEVGAASGGFGRLLRWEGFDGRIVSFEPVAAEFAELSRHAAGDDAWSVVQLAIGAVAEERTIAVSADPIASSLLPTSERHVKAFAGSAPVRGERVKVEPLDAVLPSLSRPGDRYYLKLDAQGWELEVLAGAAATLQRTVAIETELSFLPLWEGQPLVTDVVVRLDRAGFVLVRIEPFFRDPDTGAILQADGLFVRQPVRPGRGNAQPAPHDLQPSTPDLR